MMSIFISEMDIMGAKLGGSRRRHSDALKAEVIGQCQLPGASVAAIALAHALNANLVHRWLRATKASEVASSPGKQEFIELQLPPPVMRQVPIAPDIRIELRRGATAISITWPVSASVECAAWMREVLR